MALEEAASESDKKVLPSWCGYEVRIVQVRAKAEMCLLSDRLCLTGVKFGSTGVLIDDVAVHLLIAQLMVMLVLTAASRAVYDGIRSARSRNRNFDCIIVDQRM